MTLTFWFFLESLEQTTQTTQTTQEKPSRWICWGLAAVCALNVLTKGLIGLVFPVGAIGLYLLLTGNLRHLLRLRLVSSALVFFAIAAPWHILAALRNPAQGHVRGFLWFYFVNEHILRFLNRRVPRDYDTVPLVAVLGVAGFVADSVDGFSSAIVAGGAAALAGFQSEMSRRQRAILLFFLWTMVIVGFFSLSTRQEYYTIPAIPAMALLVGGWLQRAKRLRLRKAGNAGRDEFLRLCCWWSASVIAAAGFALLFFSKRRLRERISRTCLRKNPQDYALSFGHFLDLTPQAMGAFRVPVVCILARISCGHARELDLAPARARREPEMPRWP